MHLKHTSLIPDSRVVCLLRRILWSLLHHIHELVICFSKGSWKFWSTKSTIEVYSVCYELCEFCDLWRSCYHRRKARLHEIKVFFIGEQLQMKTKSFPWNLLNFSNMYAAHQKWLLGRINDQADELDEWKLCGWRKYSRPQGCVKYYLETFKNALFSKRNQTRSYFFIYFRRFLCQQICTAFRD